MKTSKNSSPEQPSKLQEVEAIRHLLSEGKASTQEDLRKNLLSMGFEINQSKISRILKKIGAAKTQNTKGEAVYQLSWEPEPPSFNTPVSHLILDITHNEILIVIRCIPGSASLIARALDFNAKEVDLIGTVAGDDNIIVVPASIHSIEKTLKKIKALFIE